MKLYGICSITGSKQGESNGQHVISVSAAATLGLGPPAFYCNLENNHMLNRQLKKHTTSFLTSN